MVGLTMFKAARRCALLALMLFSCSKLFGQSDFPDVSTLEITDPSTILPSQPLTGTVQVIIRLTDSPLGAVVGANAKHVGFQLSAEQQRAYVATLTEKQD